MFISLFLIGCSEDSNPVSNNDITVDVEDTAISCKWVSDTDVKLYVTGYDVGYGGDECSEITLYHAASSSPHIVYKLVDGANFNLLGLDYNFIFDKF
jgi:hypothetical protein